MNDSVDKIVTRYFAAVTTEPFEYKGKDFLPKPLVVSPSLFTKYIECVPNCGGCCPRFTLDWLPYELSYLSFDAKELTSPRDIILNGEPFTIHSDLQNDHEDHHCRHLDKKNGRCSIHRFNPFSCDFELLRFKEGKDRNWLGHSPFGRGWQFKRIDGERGALCVWKELRCTEEKKFEMSRKLLRLKNWTDYFKIPTVIPNIIEWIRTGPHPSSLVLNSPKKGFGI